jgi:nucleotide-binding universal stress UspA family protein
MNESGSEEHPRIVVGIDGSEGSHNALRWAARQAAYTGATVEAVIGWQYPAFYAWAPAVPDDADYVHHAHCPVTVIRPARHGHSQR